MARSRLLLLLIGLISSHLPEVQGRSTDFWCQAKTHLENKTEEFKEDMANCVGSDALPSPVQLPCEGVRAREWANKTLQQKSAEVIGALWVFQDGVRWARSQTTLQTPACQTSLLEKLEHHITNHVIIVRRLYKQNDSSQLVIRHCSSQTSLKVVLKKYTKLLNGKLKSLAPDLPDSICNL